MKFPPTLLTLSFLFSPTATLLPLPPRPANTSICDFYATSLLTPSTPPTPSSSKLLMTLLVNTFVLGNYTVPNAGVPVHGFAAPGTFNGTLVALLPYFTGDLESTNEGGVKGVSRLFLDDGGAGPLQLNKSSNGNVTSAQYNLLNHIWQYFGTILNCTAQGSPEFPKYEGKMSMFEVHKFMDLQAAQMNFFFQQVTDSARSLGFSDSDTALLLSSLQKFNTRCAPPSALPGLPDARPVLNAICLGSTCTLDKDANCALYPTSFKPANVTEEARKGNATGAGTATTTSVPAAVKTGEAARMDGAGWVVGGLAIGVVGLLAGF